MDIVARLTSRTFGGYESLQLDIRDVATAGLHAAAGVGRDRVAQATPVPEPALVADLPILVVGAAP